MALAIADKGYFSGHEILACFDAGITTTVPRPATSGNAAKGMYVKADFTYDSERDVYICPAGEELTYRSTRDERGVHRAGGGAADDAEGVATLRSRGPAPRPAGSNRARSAVSPPACVVWRAAIAAWRRSNSPLLRLPC